MAHSPRRRVLAIGLDAAEPSLIQRMIKDGELPVLQGLVDTGTWSSVRSPADVGSGTVWPTFFTGTDAVQHGFYAHWGWRPQSMSLQYYDGRRFTPFWKDLDADGVTVGVLDVPFAPFVGLSRGFEVHEWGPHDVAAGQLRLSPEPIRDVVAGVAPHPFCYDACWSAPRDREALSGMGSDGVEGVRLRGDLARRLMARTEPDLAVVVFPEAHRTGHYLWHTVEPEDPLYDDDAEAPPRASLFEVYRELDEQIGRLVEAAGPGTAVVVFSLHGMQAARGVPDILVPLLREMGLTHTRTWAERRRSLVATAKRRAPALLRDAYRSRVPLTVRGQFGKSEILPMYDWSRTRAFSLPSDQHGWVRINLRGREAQGIVAPAEYAGTCEVIERELRALTAADGRPLVADVLHPAPQPGEAHADLPDLVVHWAPAAYRPPVRVEGQDADPVRREETGQHALRGFLVADDGVVGELADEAVEARDIHRVITRALGVRP